jgi:hypothetical protein
LEVLAPGGTSKKEFVAMAHIDDVASLSGALLRGQSASMPISELLASEAANNTGSFNTKLLAIIKDLLKYDSSGFIGFFIEKSLHAAASEMIQTPGGNPFQKVQVENLRWNLEVERKNLVAEYEELMNEEED